MTCLSCWQFVASLHLSWFSLAERRSRPVLKQTQGLKTAAEQESNTERNQLLEKDEKQTNYVILLPTRASCASLLLYVDFIATSDKQQHTGNVLFKNHPGSFVMRAHTNRHTPKRR